MPWHVLHDANSVREYPAVPFFKINMFKERLVPDMAPATPLLQRIFFLFLRRWSPAILSFRLDLQFPAEEIYRRGCQLVCLRVQAKMGLEPFLMSMEANGSREKWWDWIRSDILSLGPPKHISLIRGMRPHQDREADPPLTCLRAWLTAQSCFAKDEPRIVASHLADVMLGKWASLTHCQSMI